MGEALDYASRRAEGELQHQPEVLSRVLFTIGTAYRNLGQFTLAEKLLRRSLDLYQQTKDQDGAELANLHAGLGDLYLIKGEYAQAEPLLSEALAFFHSQPAAGTGPLVSLGDALNDFGLLKLAEGHADVAEP